jgi:TolB-like protein/Flp pilus assembly protein TadD
MIYRFSEFELDTRSFQLSRAGTQVAIEPQVLDLLKYLIANRDRLVSRDELFAEIWTGRVVADTSLSSHVKSARKAIGDDGRSQSLIKTVHGRGYQFIAKAAEIMNHGSDLALLPIDDSIGGSHNSGPLVAVLPFQNMSSDPQQQFFAEGMSEDITTELSRFSDIQVIARHSAFQYNGTAPDVNKISAELGVEYLVEGSVRRTRDRVRINVQLIETHNGKQAWAEKFDRPVDQVFQIQDEITETVVSTISGQIRRIETSRSVSRGTTNLRAYDHLLRGLTYHKNGNISYENHLRASAEFNRAIELDPIFPRARAWAVCATASMWEAKSEENIETAVAEAKYALSLDENESETHRVLGSLYFYLRNYQLSGHHFNEARRLSPNDAHIAVKMARYYAYIDECDAALAEVERSMRLNPLHPGWYWQELGIIQYSRGEYQNSIETYYKNSGLDAYDLALIAASYVALGDADSAREAAQKAIAMEPRASVKMYTLFETYQDKARHQLLYDRMIAAGLPE